MRLYLDFTADIVVAGSVPVDGRDRGPIRARHQRIVGEFPPVGEISGRGLLRPPTAGVDLRGDGSVVAYSGGIRREELKLRRGGDPFDAVHDALRR